MQKGTNMSLEPLEHFVEVEGKVILLWSPKHTASWAWHGFNNVLQKHGVSLEGATGGGGGEHFIKWEKKIYR